MNATTDTYENQNSVSEKDPTHFVTACYLSTLDTAKRTPQNAYILNTLCIRYLIRKYFLS